MINLSNRIILVVICIIALSSCASQKQLQYLQNVPSEEKVYSLESPTYRIQKKDILYVNFFTLNEIITETLNNQASTTNPQSMYNSESRLYISGYSVNDSGLIHLPIGDVFVQNMTIEEAQSVIKKEAGITIKNFNVTVKLLSFKYTIMGEVGRPGVFKHYNNQLTIFEALSHAGNITDYGNRSNLLVIRPSETGNTTFKVDLTDVNILSSEAFYIMPNDMIIVEPYKTRPFMMNESVISLVLSSISTFVLIMNFIKYN